MSVLDLSGINAIKESIKATGTEVPFAGLIKEERAGKNRKTLIAWLEKQDAQSSPAEEESTMDTSVPEVEPVYEPVAEETAAAPEALVAGVDSVDGGDISINALIANLCQERDRLQRSTSCGLENIRVHLAGIKITVR